MLESGSLVGGGSIDASAGTDRARSRSLSDIAMTPALRHGHLAGRAATAAFEGHKCLLADTADIMAGACVEVHNGNLALQKSILTCQATTLDTIFTKMAEMALNNAEEYPDAADKYLRLALKAQGNCRATIETIDRIARGGTQIVKHVYVDNRGGRAIIADAVNTGGQNEKSSEQCRASAEPTHPALLSHDANGNGVPIPSRNRQETLQDARGD